MRITPIQAIVLASTAASRVSDHILNRVGFPRDHLIPVDQTAPVHGALSDSHGSSGAVEPCFQISREWKKSPTGPFNPTLVYSCLRSVPLDIDGGQLQIQGIQALSQFQSTLAYLKNPPSSYHYPAVDIEASLARIAGKLNASGYTNEYDFQMELTSLINSAMDGHFYYYSDITYVFGFVRKATILSVSKDRYSLPEVYLDGDARQLAVQNASNLLISPIIQIDGENISTWLNTYASQIGSNQDPDANYNAAMQLIPDGSLGLFRTPLHYPGPFTTVTFRNGTTRIVENYAWTGADFTGITDGASFFKKFCATSSRILELAKRSKSPSTISSHVISTTLVPSKPVPTTLVPSQAVPTTFVPFQPIPAQTSRPGPEHYPTPIIINDDGSVDGYHPSGYEDLAVLSIHTFEAANDVQFSNVVRQFLAISQTAGKKKLIIDLRGNKGGYVNLAYGLFSQIFPHLIPYGATNFRATPLLDDIGTVVSEHYAHVTNNTASPDDCDTNFSTHPFNYREHLKVDNTRFKSWKEFYGPHEYQGDHFTSQLRLNLNDIYSVFCATIPNHGNLTNTTPPVFQPQDVLLVQDGTCASTCAIFSEFMKIQAKVRTVVFGGRAQFGPMQGVGGVKGASAYDFQLLYDSMREAFDDEATPAQHNYGLERYGNLTKPMRQAIARAAVDGQGNILASVNVRNNIRYRDKTVMPLQFVYEAADCRLFYTASMIFQQDLVWKAAFESSWRNGSCVAGSTGHPSSEVDVIDPNPSLVDSSDHQSSEFAAAPELLS